MTVEELKHSISQLHREVRLGRFVREGLAEQCWQHRELLQKDDVHRLRIHTLIWEIWDACGVYDVALERLEADGLIAACGKAIEEQISAPHEFIALEFPAKQSKQERQNRYDLWRQRVVGLLAKGFALYRLQRPHASEMLDMAGQFLDKCLEKAGFPCFGTRSRLHYFQGHVYQRDHALALAGEAYGRSLHFCLARLADRLETRSAVQQEIERAFATYGLGKLEYKLGEVDFEEGRLQLAKQHAYASRVLLRTHQNKSIQMMADLLFWKIVRHETNFSTLGWKLVDEMAFCRKELSDHAPFYLEASIEFIKTCVYLRQRAAITTVPGDGCGYLTIPEAEGAIDRVIEKALDLHLTHTAFQALLVKARILHRLKRRVEARAVLRRAEGLFGANLPGRLKAEGFFVEGKLHSSGNAPATALAFFQKALAQGHSSLTFRMACQLQIADMLDRMGRLDEAHEILARAETLLPSVENLFLHERFEKLQKKIDPFVTVIHYNKTFQYETSRDELEKKFLSWLGHQVGGGPWDALKHWKDAGQHTRLTRQQITTLLERHYPRPTSSRR